jgi:endonuclease YncB( thermonuclease family)
VVDGDTIKVRQGDGRVETVPLIGIDTPEVADPRTPVQCFGREASARAKEILANKRVRLEQDPSQDSRDQYGRLLAYVWLEDGTLFNKQLIEEGYVHEYTYRTPYKYQAEFRAAEERARQEELGLWSPDTCNGDTTQPAETPTPQPSPTATKPAATATAQRTAPPTATPRPTPPPAQPAVKEPFYANRAAARAAGAAPLYRGQPGYRPALDRDNDGIACE